MRAVFERQADQPLAVRPTACWPQGPCPPNKSCCAAPQASLVHEGQGGALYTWGGVNESVAFGSSEKHDSNKVGLPAEHVSSSRCPACRGCAMHCGGVFLPAGCPAAAGCSGALGAGTCLPGRSRAFLLAEASVHCMATKLDTHLTRSAGLPGPRRGGPVPRPAAAHARAGRSGAPPGWAPAELLLELEVGLQACAYQRRQQLAVVCRCSSTRMQIAGMRAQHPTALPPFACSAARGGGQPPDGGCHHRWPRVPDGCDRRLWALQALPLGGRHAAGARARAAAR